MSDVTISCLQIYNPLAEGSAFVDLENSVLNTFHGFRVAQELVNHMQPRVMDTETYPYQYNFPSLIWENIFNYLPAKDIFCFVIAATRWCHSCDLNELRNKYAFFASTRYTRDVNFNIDFIQVLSNLTANERVKLTTFESIERHPFPHVTTYEGLRLDAFLLLHLKAAGVTHYGKIHISSAIFRLTLTERQDWLTRLQRLDISSANFKMGDMINILNCCLHLLDLKIQFKEDALHASYADLTINDDLKLERLDLSDSHLVVRDFQLILEKIPNLRVLILKNFKMIRYLADLVLVPDSLRHLQKMILQGANFTGKDIYTFLMAAPHVNEVDLSCQTIADGGLGSGYAFGPGLPGPPRTRLHNSFSELPENSLASLEMIHMSPTFFASGRMHIPIEMVMQPLVSSIFDSSMYKKLLSQCAFTLKDLEAFLKAAPNLYLRLRELFERQIEIQKKFVARIEAERARIIEADRARNAEVFAFPCAIPTHPLVAEMRSLSEQMKRDTQRLKEDNERALHKMKRDIKKSKKWK